MSTYVAIPLTASVLLVAFGCVVLTMAPDQSANRRAGTLLLGAGYWAFCEVLWNGAPDPATAALLHRMALPGMLFMAPVGLALVGEVTEERVPWLPALTRLSMASGAVFLVIGWTTPWIVDHMVRTDWGYGLVPGPAFSIWLVTTAVLTLGGLFDLSRRQRRSSAWIARVNGPHVVAFTAVTFLPGAISDGVLPVMGYQLPRVGTLCFAGFGAMLVWAIHRYGYATLPNTAVARRILRNLPDGLALTSLVGRIQNANLRLEELLGVPSGGATGLAVREILDVPLVDPPREVRQVQCTLQPVNGEPIPVQLSSTVVNDNQGRPIGLVVIVSDQREVVSLRNQVITSDRLAAVGQLAAGIAHEINNPLAFARANLVWLRDEWAALSAEIGKCPEHEALLASAAELGGSIDESLEGVDRAATIVRDIREFSHVGTGEFEEADVNGLLEQVLRIAGGQLGTRIRVVRRFAALPLLRCRPQRIRQLFLNLVVNAAQSIEAEGTIEIRTEGRAGRIVIDFMDDGCGIPPGLRDRIFDPFFTTKEVGVGTGLGLAISYEIVRGHGGSIETTARPGGGTTFTVTIPLDGMGDGSPAAAEA